MAVPDPTRRGKGLQDLMLECNYYPTKVFGYELCNMTGNHLYQVGGIASYMHDTQSIMICVCSVTVW